MAYDVIETIKHDSEHSVDIPWAQNVDAAMAIASVARIITDHEHDPDGPKLVAITVEMS